MAHDAKGNPLAIGDKVIIRATITELFSERDEWNLVAELDVPTRPGGPKYRLADLNAAQVEKA
jgi:hypothetical protein